MQVPLFNFLVVNVEAWGFLNVEVDFVQLFQATNLSLVEIEVCKA